MADQLDELQAALADRYAIERELGRGGMATVYLAEDMKHHRKVAVKVLRPELAAAIGPDRFLREIQITARLNHPHILPLLDSGAAAGFLYYVMPFVEGESLRDRLTREKQLPIDAALTIAREVADALSFAHAHNVIHRDIKPENILLEANHAVVADFGLARAVERAGETRLTETGIAMGTPAYLSPEQASGARELDGRTDLYALGCVLYEMLAGQPPFTGSTAESIVHQHLTTTPHSVTEVRPTVPGDLAATVSRALAKAPADRFSSAAQFGEAIAASAVITPSGAVAVDRRATRRWLMVGAVVGVAALVIAVIVVGTQLFTSGPIIVTTSNITRVTHETGIEFQPAISPDGEEVAYIVGPIDNARLVVRSTIDAGSGGESRPAAEVGGPHVEPSWTPDGASLRFSVGTAESEWSWYEVGKYGGSVQTIPRPWGADYHDVLSPDGARVVFSRGDSIFGYDDDEGEPELLGVHPVESLHPFPFAWSPNGQLIAYAAPGIAIRDLRTQGGASQSIWIIDADGGEPRRVTGEGFVHTSPAWLDDERLLFVSNRDGPREVYVVELAASGPRGVPRKVAGVTDPHTISYSVGGRKLAFSKAALRQNIWSYPVDSGAVSIGAGHPVTNENAQIRAHDISPDGRWIVYSSDLRGGLDIYKRPVEGGNTTLIAGSSSGEFDPRWSPEGSEIAFHSPLRGEVPVLVVSSDGGTPLPVASVPGSFLCAWSPSGLELAFTSNQSGQWDTWVVSREAIGRPWGEPTQLTDFGCLSSDWAPDGSGVLCSVGLVPEEIVLVSLGGAVLWRYDPSTLGLVLANIHQTFSRDGSTIYARGRHEDGRGGMWAIPVKGGEPSLVVAYDRADITAERWLAVGPDRLYLTVQQTEVDIWVADVKIER